MSTNSSHQPAIVHEAIDQRQYVRTFLPVQVALLIKGLEFYCEVADISLGGMAILITDNLKPWLKNIKKNSIISAQVNLGLHAFSLNMYCDVKPVGYKDSVLRVAFHNWDPSQMDTLRHIISSHLSGEIVRVDDVFNVMKRENYVTSRKKKTETPRTIADRMKAVFGTALQVVLGILCLYFTASKFYEHLFTVQSTSAIVHGDPYVVQMPDDGYVDFLIDPTVRNVAIGQPIASFSNQLGTKINAAGILGQNHRLSGPELKELLEDTILETVVTSPCDCWVYYPNNLRSDRYTYKGQELVHLLPRDGPLKVKAQFPFEKLKDINKVSSVMIEFLGLQNPVPAKVSRTNVTDNGKMIEIILKSQIPNGRSRYLEPVTVTVIKGLSL